MPTLRLIPLCCAWLPALAAAQTPGPGPEGAGVDAGALGAPNPPGPEGGTLLFMSPGEYRIDAVDATHNQVSVQVNGELAPSQNRAAMRLHGPQTIIVPLPGGMLRDVLEADKSGNMDLELEVEPVPPAGGDESPLAPLDFRPVHAAFSIGRMPVAETGVTSPTAPRVPARPSPVSIGDVQGEPALDTAHRAQSTLEALGVAHRCAERMRSEFAAVRGSLTMELERSLVGQPERPRLVVDAAVCRHLEECLTDELARDGALWEAIEPGQHVFVPFYFTGGEDGATDGSAGGNGPAVNGHVWP